MKSNMETRHLKCPECNALGMIGKPENHDNFRLIEGPLRIEGVGENQKIVCAECKVEAVFVTSN